MVSALSQNHRPSPLMTMEPALDRRHCIFDLYHLLACAEGAVIQQLVDLDVVTLNCFLRSSFNPENGSIILSIFTDVVQHQLRLACSTEPPYY